LNTAGVQSEQKVCGIYLFLGWWDWLTPFSVLAGVGVCAGYTLLGATWLVMKTEGLLQEKMRRAAWYLAIVTLIFTGVVSVITPFLHPAYFERWFSLPTSIFTGIVPALVFCAGWYLFTGLRDKSDYSPFLASLALFTLCFAGIIIGFYPNIIPPSLTIHEAAAPRESLLFALYGTVVLIPLILGYTAYAYWVFRGKVDPAEGYH